MRIAHRSSAGPRCGSSRSGVDAPGEQDSAERTRRGAVMTIRSETVDLHVDGQPMAAVVTHPDGRGPWPGIVVIMEAFGLNEYIRDVSRQLAEEGYIAVAPDFYHRLGRLKTAGYDDFDASRRLMATMRDDEVVKDASA